MELAHCIVPTCSTPPAWRAYVFLWPKVASIYGDAVAEFATAAYTCGRHKNSPMLVNIITDELWREIEIALRAIGGTVTRADTAIVLHPYVPVLSIEERHEKDNGRQARPIQSFTQTSDRIAAD